MAFEERMVRSLHVGTMAAADLTGGHDHRSLFQASTIAMTTIDVGNPATNVIPAQAKATFNIRFNDMHTSDTLSTWIRETLDAAADGTPYELSIRVSGESFVFPPGELSGLISDACEKVVGQRPELSTTGGTSDARFIKDHCPVAEFGLISQTMHKVDERTLVDDINKLSEIYETILRGYFR